MAEARACGPGGPRALYLLDRIDQAIERVTGCAPYEGVAERMSEILTGVAVGSVEECFRAYTGPDVWANYLFMRWEREGRPPVVIADTRFPNESAAIRKRAGVVILVRREAAERADGRSATHVSERALDGEKPDVTLDNNGTIADLGEALGKAWPGVQQVAGARTL